MSNETRFAISATPIEATAQQRALADARAGACVTFEGWVRNRNEGQPVLSLEYEAYAPLAEKEGARILAEAREKFDIVGAACVHRVGHLQLGDMAVWVGVASEHRAAAFLRHERPGPFLVQQLPGIVVDPQMHSRVRPGRVDPHVGQRHPAHGRCTIETDVDMHIHPPAQRRRLSA